MVGPVGEAAADGSHPPRPADPKSSTIAASLVERSMAMADVAIIARSQNLILLGGKLGQLL